jgi:beta-N-acetylhexosaminidase/D-alanyl-D-alanine dipeptidase
VPTPAIVIADAAQPGDGASTGLDAAAAESIELSDSDFVDLQSVLPQVELDMRYATTNNFVGKVIYPKARCLLRRPVALALKEAQRLLELEGLQLLVWDCYRPFSVQERFWELVPDKRYVARPQRRAGQLAKGSKHNRGAAIDLGLLALDASPVPLPTDYDDFSERAHHGAEGIPKAASGNARTLRRAMQSAGFQGIQTEWWHFDHERWREFPLSDEPL